MLRVPFCIDKFCNLPLFSCKMYIKKISLFISLSFLHFFFFLFFYFILLLSLPLAVFSCSLRSLFKLSFSFFLSIPLFFYFFFLFSWRFSRRWFQCLQWAKLSVELCVPTWSISEKFHHEGIIYDKHRHTYGSSGKVQKKVGQVDYNILNESSLAEHFTKISTADQQLFWFFWLSGEIGKFNTDPALDSLDARLKTTCLWY